MQDIENGRYELLEERRAKMAKIVDLTTGDDDDVQSTTSASGSKSGYTTPSADKSTSGMLIPTNYITYFNYCKVVNILFISNRSHKQSKRFFFITTAFLQ